MLFEIIVATTTATALASAIHNLLIKNTKAQIYNELELSLSMRQTNLMEEKKDKWNKIYRRLDQLESGSKNIQESVYHTLDGYRMRLDEQSSVVDATISDLTWAKTGLSNLEVEVKHLSQSFEYLAKQDAQDLINELKVELVPVVKATKKKSKKLPPPSKFDNYLTIVE